MEQDASFGRWLRARRTALDLTQEQLGHCAGCTAATIRKIEADERLPSRENAVRLATCLQIPSAEQDAFIRFARHARSGGARSFPAFSAPPFPTEHSPFSTASPASDLAVVPPPLVGRDGDLAAAQQHLEGVLRGRGALVFVSGEAGIGKTSLALAIGWRAQAAGAVFALGRCYESPAVPVFAPWLDLLADLALHTSLDFTALPPPFGDGPSAQTSYYLMRSVVSALRTVTTLRPVVLLLDDLHLADRDTLDLLAFVTRHLDQLALLVMVTYRAEDVQRKHPLSDVLPQLYRDRPTETIRLGALDVADAARLVKSRYDRCSSALAAYLHTRSDGNPLYMVELLRDLTQQRLLARDEEGRLLPPAGNTQVPAILEQVITQRIARLGAHVESFLSTAAVVGEEWELAVVEAVLAWPEETILQALEIGLATHVVTSGDGGSERYRFTHGLIREVLAGRQLARRRKQLHARIVAALENLAAVGYKPAPDVSLLAYHYYAAEAWTKAVPYCLEAGDLALNRNASHSALHSYEHALAAAQRLPHVDRHMLLTLNERVGHAHMLLNQREQAEVAFAHMLQVAQADDDQLAEGRALYWLSQIRARLYQMAEAHATSEAALRTAMQAADSHLLALTYWNRGHLALVTGDLKQADQMLDRGAQLAREGKTADVLGRCLQDLALLRVWQGSYAPAARLAGEALDLVRASHDPLVIASACFRLGLSLGEAGHVERAREVVQSGITYAEEVGDQHNLVKLLNTMGWLHYEIGDLDSALRWDLRARDAAGYQSDARAGEALRYTLLNLATDELAAGHLQQAERYLAEFERMLDDIEYARFRYLNRYQLVRAEVALAQGGLNAARGWAQEAAALATAKGMRKNLVKSQLLIGRTLLVLGRSREAVELLHTVVERADALEHQSLRWQARWWLGQACAAQRQLPTARDHYRQALDQVQAIAAELEDERLRTCFLRSPLVENLRAAMAATEDRAAERAARQGDAASFPAGLTAREVEVLRLVVQGATNGAIAAVLHLSVKTVEVHMTSILGKTACANRAAAVAFALRHSLV